MNFREYIDLDYMEKINDKFYLSDRDIMIIEDLASDSSSIHIAKKYNLSEERIRQIGHKYLLFCFFIDKLKK